MSKKKSFEELWLYQKFEYMFPNQAKFVNTFHMNEKGDTLVLLGTKVKYMFAYVDDSTWTMTCVERT